MVQYFVNAKLEFDASYIYNDVNHAIQCFAYKLLQTHHCRVCRRCVLKMEHHCLWINNCVGYANYKAFFVLVFYATMACIYSTVLLVCCVFKNANSYSGNVPLKTFMETQDTEGEEQELL